MKSENLVKGIGNRILIAMADANITPTMVERDIGIFHGNLNRYCKEEMLPGANTLYTLCKYLGVSADYLLFGTKGSD